MTNGNGRVQRLKEISRRDFFKQASGAAVASVAFIGIGVPGLLKKSAFPEIAQSSGVIMPDPSLCIGCLTCEVACSDVHREVGLSDIPRIRIYNLESVQVNPQVTAAFGQRGRFHQQVCLQCPDAPCLPVCPVDALRVDGKTGARVIDKDTCIACGKCEQSCIFPTLDEALATGKQHLNERSRITHDAKRNVYTKCDLCYFREEGPACIERCPVNIKIHEGAIKSDTLCLDLLKPVNATNFEKMRKLQTVNAARTEMSN
jgi:Fe-S-cluster-containing hydrogenase component 2